MYLENENTMLEDVADNSIRNFIYNIKENSRSKL
jgi:hypothetical protein